MRWYRAALALAPFLALQFPEIAHAGPPEELLQFVAHPTNPNVMTVRYFNGGDGMFVTTDGGAHWKLLCDALLFDFVTNHSGPIAISADGTTTMGVFSGMWHDDGHACGWRSESQYDGLYIGGFAVDPLDPTLTYAVTRSGGKLNGMLRRDASGTWSDLGTRGHFLIPDLKVVPYHGGRRFYMGAVADKITDGGGSEPDYVTRVSDDEGASWTDHDYGAADGILQLQAVDPTNPARLVVSIERSEDGGEPPGSARDTVLVSNDAGATFKKYLTLTEIGGVAFAPDGRVWIGDAGAPADSTQPRGVWFAPSLDVPATKLPNSDYPVACLGYQPATNTLYACQPTQFGPVDTTDGSFTTSLDVRTVAAFVDCAGVDMAAACQEQLCGAYCGIGHFAQAPLCCSYSSLTCGPTAAIPGTASCPSAGGASGTGAHPNITDAGHPNAGAGGGGTADGGRDPARAAHDGGCCAIVGDASPADPAAPSAFAALAATTLLLRRRRRC